MKLGITGARGLLGFHARCLLHAAGDAHEVRVADRVTFSSPMALDAFVDGLDGVLHFAGVNRGAPEEVEAANPAIAADFLQALSRTGARPAIAYANSTHADRDTAYGRSKSQTAALLMQWGAQHNVRVANFVLPHVFGEYGRPFYNSVVSTFCHQLANGDAPHIDMDGELELVHAQDVAGHFMRWLQDPLAGGGLMRVQGEPMKVSALLRRLRDLQIRYVDDGVVPDVTNPLTLRLFNTLRSYLYPTHYPRVLRLHQDARGGLFEAIKADQGGQAFMSTTLPGVTRGNHWHLQKIERFLVIRGRGVVRLRRLFDGAITTFEVDGDHPAYIDIPTLHTHCITNVGEEVLQTLFWSNEIFDPRHPDTYPETVQP